MRTTAHLPNKVLYLILLIILLHNSQITAMVTITCPPDDNGPLMQTQEEVDLAFDAWLDMASASGDCAFIITNDATGAPSVCTGGSVTVSFTATGDCGVDTCSAIFNVEQFPTPFVFTCPGNVVQAACQSQNTIDSLHSLWVNSASVTGGCNPILYNNAGPAPDICTGGAVFVTFSVGDNAGTESCTASFEVAPPPILNINCPAAVVEVNCQSQAAIDAAYTTWINSASASGGCNPFLYNNSGPAPDICTGGVVFVTFTVSDNCGTKSCTSTFEVVPSPVIEIVCPSDTIQAACMTQSEVNAAFIAWQNTAVASGGCNPFLFNDAGPAPDPCTGGSAFVTFTAADNCSSSSCSSLFTVNFPNSLQLNCPEDITYPACLQQTDINNAFNNWVNSATMAGGCNAVLANDATIAPTVCAGGSVTVNFSATGNCDALTCSSTFTVETPVVAVNCPANVAYPACQDQSDIDSLFIAWLNTASVSGGCGAIVINNAGGIPNACTDANTNILFTGLDLCGLSVNCMATFTIGDPPCPNDVSLSGTENTGTVLWSTDVSISSTATIPIGSNTTYQSGTIFLNAGFEVEQGAVFEALIGTCSGALPRAEK